MFCDNIETCEMYHILSCFNFAVKYYTPTHNKPLKYECFGKSQKYKTTSVTGNSQNETEAPSINQ